MSEKLVCLEITCVDEDKCVVSFEPWGAAYDLAPGDVFYVEVKGPGSGILQILHDPSGISVWTWEGGKFTVRNEAGTALPT